jgi:hypothetical protein
MKSKFSGCFRSSFRCSRRYSGSCTMSQQRSHVQAPHMMSGGQHSEHSAFAERSRLLDWCEEPATCPPTGHVVIFVLALRSQCRSLGG